MRKITVLAVVALLLCSWSAIAVIPSAACRGAVEEICAREPLSSSVVGLLAVSMDGDTLVAVNPSLKLVPASNVKLLTTGLALKQLGEDYRFKTTLAYEGEIRDGILFGDLYIVGGGDPTTGARVDCADPVELLFSRWHKMILDAGICGVEGRIVGDPRFFDASTPENLGWTYDDLGTSYGVGPLGLNFFENAQHFLITPGPGVGDSPSVSPKYPLTPWMKYSVSAVTGSARTANTVYYVNTPLAPLGDFGGSFPVDRRAYTFEGSNRFGAYTCAYHFLEYLESKGFGASGGCADISSGGRIRTEPGISDTGSLAADPEELVTIGETYSARLSEIVRETNTESDNFFAETLLRMIGKSRGYSCREDDPVRAAEELMRSLGLQTAGACRIFDGSGLSRKNYVSAAFFVSFLQAMAREPFFDAYLRSLPYPGSRGTLEFKFPDAPDAFKSRIRMKSGSMNGVLCYSGYILPSDGDESKTIVFSLLTNNFTSSSWMVSPAIDGIIGAIAAEN